MINGRHKDPDWSSTFALSGLKIGREARRKGPCALCPQLRRTSGQVAELTPLVPDLLAGDSLADRATPTAPPTSPAPPAKPDCPHQQIIALPTADLQPNCQAPRQADKPNYDQIIGSLKAGLDAYAQRQIWRDVIVGRALEFLFFLIKIIYRRIRTWNTSSPTSEIIMLTRACNGMIVKRNRQRGATLVEFALIAPMLFFLLFIIMELGIMFWVNLTMQYAVREGARYAITGQSDLDPATANQQRYVAVIQRIKDSSMGLYSQVNPVIVVNGVSRLPSGYNNSMFGAQDEIVVLQLNCTWPVVTPAWRLMALLNPAAQSSLPGAYAFSVAATMRNESYK